MKYRSTRGSTRTMSSAEAIITGIAEDGGLFVPDNLPKIDGVFIEGLVDLTYQERAEKILQKFLTDYTEPELRGCIGYAYGEEKFGDAAVAPVVHLGNAHVLELWHGPTSAFKDMALQLLPQLMSTALAKTGEQKEIMILVATSGDTGKAALEGFKDVDQIRIMVFYPEAGVSNIQRLQMVTQRGGNVEVIAVKGNFDDAQTGVKQIFNDEALNALLNESGVQLSSANSINWGRLVPQIVYYFSAYADLIKEKVIKSKDLVNFTVPTGNFGNILAGYYAKQMGLPIQRLICASNVNNVLTDFLKTGRYDRKRAFYKTCTPSMDILISSNLERLLYHITDGNTAKIKGWMNELNALGEYEVGEDTLNKIQETFWSGWANDEKTLEKIREVYEKYHYVVDTHTAVAWQVAESYQKETGDQTVNVIVSTASPYKFSDSVLTALGTEISSVADQFAKLSLLEQLSDVKIPGGLASLEDALVLHHKNCEKADMPEMVKMMGQPSL